MTSTRPTAAAAALLAALVGATAFVVGCAGAPAKGTGAAAALVPAADTAKAGVLASFVGRPLVVAPTQRLRVAADAPPWAPAASDTRDYLAALDDEITSALTDRGVAGGWQLAEQVARSARRNPTFATDAHALAIDQLLPSARAAAVDLRDPLRSQLRAMTALSEARDVLVPVELRFERVAGDPSAARAVLHLALVDTRLARVRWSGDVAGDAATSLSAALLASVADRVANLAAPAR
ncbi:MAG TPA: hypothetical protein VFJ74_01410 [Gemmatimonadaceae bacterium]|nr:hypothetical protein [Gemmatimonadaceae bacterium]